MDFAGGGGGGGAEGADTKHGGEQRHGSLIARRTTEAGLCIKLIFIESIMIAPHPPPPAIAVNVFRFLHTPLSTLTTHTHTHTQTNTEKYKFQLFPICFVFRPQIAFNESCGRFGRLRVPSSFVLLLLLLFRFFLRLVSFLYSFCVCRCLARRPLRPPRPSPAQYVQKGGATNNSRST